MFHIRVAIETLDKSEIYYDVNHSRAIMSLILQGKGCNKTVKH